MKTFRRSFIIFFTLLFSLVVFTMGVSADEWRLSSGGISQDETTMSGSFLGTGAIGTGSGPAINISIGTGQDFFESSMLIEPTIDISGASNVVAQIAVVLGDKNQSITVYNDPDNALFPWSNTPVDVFIGGAKNFKLFSFEGTTIMGLVPALQDSLLPFGIFVRLLDSSGGNVIKQASFKSFILSADMSATINQITEPW